MSNDKAPLRHPSLGQQWCWCPDCKTQALCAWSDEDVPICRACKKEMVRRYMDRPRGEKKMKCAICKETFTKHDLDKCPCGKRVCGDCEDGGIYSDETCCKLCAAEFRRAWAECGKHLYSDPSENDDGVMIAECKHCGHPALVEAQAVNNGEE